MCLLGQSALNGGTRGVGKRDEVSKEAGAEGVAASSAPPRERES